MEFRHLVPVALVITLAGCGAIGAIGLPWKRSPDATAAGQPLPSASAVPPVDSTDLGPPGGTTVDSSGADAASQPLSPPPTSDTALSAPTGSGVNGGLGRTDLLGGWTITTGTDSCQLFMTLTSWTGGYRASTRGCTDQLLKSIQAWNLQSGQVILAGQAGAPLAKLASSGNNRFDGQVNGQTISFYR